MATPMSALRALETMPGPGKGFIFTVGNRMTEKLMAEGATHKRLFKLHVGPRKVVVVTHPQLAREIITRPAVFTKLKVETPRIADALDADETGEPQNIVMANGAKWQSLRKPVDPAFETKAVQQVVPIFNEVSEKLVQKWEKHASGVIDVKADMSAFALDALGAAVLGRDFGALTGEFEETYEHYKYIMQQQTNPLYMAFPFLEQVPFLPRNRKLKVSIAHMRAMLQAAVDARLAERFAANHHEESALPNRDMLDLVLNSSQGGDGSIPLGAVAPLLWIFFVAGHDTTAIALTWMVHHLAMNTEIQARARAEALEVLNGSNDPTALQLEKERMPYISALIKENLRLRPPVYNLMTRHAEEDTDLDGYFIPKKTMIAIHIAAVNRHPDVYANPDEFDPERFLDGKRMRVFENMPFSAGPRRCLGDKFSILEQRVLLAKILSRLELLPEDGAAGEVPFAGDSIPIVFGQPESMRVRVRAL